MAMRQVTARFDDRRKGEELSIELVSLTDVLVARTLDEVVTVLESAEAAAERGSWVAGWVAYEAAPAFDDALVVNDPDPGLPLAYFAVFDDAVYDAPLDDGSYEIGSWEPEISEMAYQDAIGRIHELITAGETYQTNYTLRLRGAFEGSAPAFYRDLVEAQRGGAISDAQADALIAASSEIVVIIDPDGPCY